MTDSGMHAPAQSGEILRIPGYPAKEALLRLPSQPPVRTNVDAPSTPAPGIPCPTLAEFGAHTAAAKESRQPSAVGVPPAVSPLISSFGPESCLRPAITTAAPNTFSW